MDNILDPEKLNDRESKFWTVDSKGNIIHCEDPRFNIAAEDLTINNWVDHILSKPNWRGGDAAAREFYGAYKEALKRVGIKSVTINLNKPFDFEKIER